MPGKQAAGDRLARKLASYGLGVGAVAAGIVLPQKASADIINESFPGVTTTNNYGVLYLRFPYQTDILAGTRGTFGCGFNFELACTGSESGFCFAGRTASGAATYAYSILAYVSGTVPAAVRTWATPDPGFNLASFCTTYYGWATQTYQLTLLSLGVPVYVGLRMSGSSGTYHGWAQIELGSLTINQAAFNDQDAGSMYPGQIPEPSPLLLLVSGAAGLAALRLHRREDDQPI